MFITPMRTLRIVVATASMSLVGASAAAPSTTLRDHPGVSATMEIAPGVCPATLPVTIRANSVNDLRQSSRAVAKVMAWAQVNADMTCPQSASIEIVGLVNGATVYKGLAQKSENWALVEVPTVGLPPVAQMSPEPRASSNAIGAAEPTRSQPATATASPVITQPSITPCDRLGAHPDDPEAFTQGVSDSKLDATAVIRACEAAIKADAITPRLRFQLARGYLKADRIEDAVEQLMLAAQEGHGGALAYLADLVLDGAPGLDADPVLARQLYERSLASGFTPAKKVLDEFEDMTDVVAKDEAEDAQAAMPVASAKQQSFVEPDIMNNILSRQFDNIGVDEIWTKKYLVNIADNIRAVCSTHFSQSDVDRLKREAADDHYRVASNQTLGGGMMGTLATMLAMRDNPGAYAQQASSRSEDGFDEAMKDTGALFQRHMCNTPGLNSFSKNLAAYVTNQDAPLPPLDAIKRACLSDPPPSRYDAQQFCMCFGSLLQSTSVSQKQRKNLVSDFRKTSIEVMDRNQGPYRVCTQGPR